MCRLLSILGFTLLISACGGGGGGSSNAAPEAPPGPSQPTADPTALTLIDAQPANDAAMASLQNPAISFSHEGQSDLTIALEDDCMSSRSTTVRRAAFDLSGTDTDQLIEHRIRCELAENQTILATMDGTRPNDAMFTADFSFSTGVVDPNVLTVTDQVTRTRDDINDMFTGYVEGALISDLDVSDSIAALLLDTIIEISEANWDNLTDPDALYPVSAQQVSYPSRDPSGEPSLLSGLIAVPVIDGVTDFVARESLIVLSHATGSTPGDLSPEDAWFILANQLASRGYLVVAPDNYGRGITVDEPETYLMASRTADNAIDLISQVIESPDYQEIYSGSVVTIVGYSQGGHSAIDLWLSLSTNGPADVAIDRVYAGGAPHNLYQTFRGVIEHLNASCNDGVYCRYVDSGTTLPFATDRILPGFLSYTNTGLTQSEIITDEGNIEPSFIADFIGNAERVDRLKALLQLSSFSDIVNFSELALPGTPEIHLYHSDFDRLVPSANTNELADRLSPIANVDFHDGRCNGSGYELIFGLTETVGAIHTLCGLSVLDDAMEDLK